MGALRSITKRELSATSTVSFPETIATETPAITPMQTTKNATRPRVVPMKVAKVYFKNFHIIQVFLFKNKELAKQQVHIKAKVTFSPEELKHSGGE